MKRVLVLYQSPVFAEDQMAHATPERANAGMDACLTWAGKASAIVELGAPLGIGRDIEAGSNATGPTEVRGYSSSQ